MGQDRNTQYLIVGLGNPGLEYSSTPHNLGFLAIDRLASEEGIGVTRPEGKSVVGRGEIAGKPIVLAKPLSFMNSSGIPTKELLNRYHARPTDILVIFDDLALSWGALRLRLHGSAGGHRGVQSLIEKLGTVEFPRLRLGIDPGRPYGNGADFVLRPFGKEQQGELDSLLNRTVKAVRLYLSHGAAKAMTEINRRAGEEVEVK